MNKLRYLVTFGIGVVVGAGVTWKYTTDKYEKQRQEDMNSLRRIIVENHLEDDEEIEEKLEEEVVEDTHVDTIVTPLKPDIMEYAAMLQKSGYIDYTNVSVNGDEEPIEDDLAQIDIPVTVDRPYVITPEDYGEFDDYETISLTYYGEDGILTDENDEIVDDPDYIIGLESLASFGEYEDDSVFVRNDTLKCDYEVLWDNRKYADVVITKPYILEG